MFFSLDTRLQLGIIKNTIEDKRDQLVVMATGRGKSLCYQFPSLYSKGLAVVISPLISLMEVFNLLYRFLITNNNFSQ